jgi:ankyrin repeat protein
MHKRNIAVHLQTVLTLAPALGIIFPWLQYFVPSAYWFVVPADGPPFAETLLPLFGFLSIGFGLLALMVFSLSKSQSTSLLRVFTQGHIGYSVLAILIWIVFFGSRAIIHFPVKESGFYLLFAISVLPHLFWIFLLRWCLRQLKPHADRPRLDGRKPVHLTGPALVVLTIMTASVFKPHAPLNEAIQSGDYNSVRSMLQENPEAANDESWHDEVKLPLLEAIEKKDMQMIEMLLDAGAEVNPIHSNSHKPLSKAILIGETPIVELLLKHGAEVNPPDAGFFTPLIQAIKWGNTDIVNLLVEHGADVNAKLSAGRGNTSDIIVNTPLKAAAESGDVDATRILLDYGADVTIKGPNDDAAIHKACDSHSKAKKLLDVLTLLIEAGAEIDDRGYQNRTPLHLVARGRFIYDASEKREYYLPIDTAVIRYLLDMGADPKATDDSGLTPLDYALNNGHTEIATLIQNAVIQPGESLEDIWP